MRKIFTFLFATLMSVGMFAATVTWDNSTLSSIYLHGGDSFTKDGVTLTVLDGMIDGRNFMGFSNEASFKFSTSLGNFTKIEITGNINALGGSGWTQTITGAVWTGEANETTFGMSFDNVSQIVFTIGEPEPEPEPAEVTVVFAANNKTVERTVTLPHTFKCSWDNGMDGPDELDIIIHELYNDYYYCNNNIQASGSDQVEAGTEEAPKNDYITIKGVFEGTATVTGDYFDWITGEEGKHNYSITISIKGDEPAPTTYTLQLVADPEKGSVAVTNLLGSDIIDNGNGNYTVPENAEVTILATPLEGYEFTGWKVGNIDEMVGCYYCGTALNTEDNPYTFTMTADVAYLAEFEAAAPQPDPTVMFIAFPTENRPENIEIAGVNREFTWAMVALDNDPWYVSKEHLNTYATDTIKFRDAANNAMILCEFIPANGDQEGRWQQLYLVMGDYPMDSYKLDIVRYIDELDLSNASNYAWMENAPEPQPEGIEEIIVNRKSSNRKFIKDGMIYIVRDGKLFNAQGAEIKY